MSYIYHSMTNREGLCSRRRRSANTIPPTTDSTLIFHYNRSKNRFDRNFYSSALTHGRLSWDKVDDFLCEIEFILKKQARSLRFGVGLMFFLLFFGITSLFSMMADLTDESSDFYDEDDLDNCGFSMFVYFIVLMVGSIALQIRSKKTMKKARKSIQAVIDRSRQVLEPLGLRWNLPEHFPYWIELWKDYQSPPALVYPGYQTYCSYMTPHPAQIALQRPIIQNPIYNHYSQESQRGFMYQPLQQNQQGGNIYQPPVISHNDSSNEFES